MMFASTKSTLRVRFAETDKFGFAYHGAYFAWFEVARTDWLRHQGLTYVQLMEKGIHLPVTSTHAKFLLPVAYDDVLEITTTLERATGVRLTFNYELRRENAPEILTRAHTEHAAVDDNGRLMRLPEDLLRLLK